LRLCGKDGRSRRELTIAGLGLEKDSNALALRQILEKRSLKTFSVMNKSQLALILAKRIEIE
jgi:hypothetical protein